MFVSSLSAQRRNPQSTIRNPQYFRFAAAEKVQPITAPVFISTGEANASMEAKEPILGISLGGESHAYSVWQMERVFVVNDRIAGRNVAVTWCPFSHTAVAFSRDVNGKTLTFEADGRVLNDTIVLRDRETGTTWTQQDGRAVEGSNSGARLQQLPVLQTNWKEWKAEQASALVLDKGKAGIHSSAFADYDADSSKVGFGNVIMAEPRMSGKALIVGIVSGNDRLAVPLTRVKQEAVINVVVDQQAMVILYDTANDTVRVVRGEARGHKVSLRRGPLTDLYGRRVEPYLLDEETTSRWDFTGKSFQGKMIDQQLLLVPYRGEYWYAWQAFFPKSRVE